MPCSALIEREAADHLEDHVVHGVPLIQIVLGIHADGLRDIVVDVAVAQMAEGDEPRAGMKRATAASAAARKRGTCETAPKCRA